MAKRIKVIKIAFTIAIAILAVQLAARYVIKWDADRLHKAFHRGEISMLHTCRSGHPACFPPHLTLPPKKPEII